MDEEDDLRRALELSMADINVASVQSSTRSSSSAPPPNAKRRRAITDPYLLNEEEKRRLFEQVFGRGVLEEDVKRWEASYFTFSEDAKFGLWQRQGGPCGVLVPLQGLLLRILLFPKASEGTPLLAPPNDVSNERRWQALFSALALTLARTSQDHISSVVSSEKNGLMVHSFGSADEIVKFFADKGREALSQPGSLLHFIYSILLTRGIEVIREDMDDDSQPLIGRFGHCSQELVNLMLFGAATSNVFDGCQDVGGGMMLKGVTVPRVDVGYLSEVEAMRYVTVGERLKFPDFPIWVVGSQTHYTLLFSGDTGVRIVGDNAEERKIKALFDRHCIDPESGMCSVTHLDKILDAVKPNNRATVKQNLMADGTDIFLWSDILALIDRQETAVQKFDMYLYDGQDPPGPRLRKFVLETCDLDSLIGQPDADSFTSALRTRWQMCLVSGLEL